MLPQVMGVQTASAVCAGLTSSVFTNPLDVIKTRLQVIQQSCGPGSQSQMLATPGSRSDCFGVRQSTGRHHHAAVRGSATPHATPAVSLKTRSF